MSIASLLNITKTEPELLEMVAVELQNNFLKHQNQFVFLKLEKCGPNLSKFSWLKTFDDPQAFDHFIFETEYFRSCLMVKFEDGEYVALCQGFWWNNKIEINRTHKTIGRPWVEKSNPENCKMMPRELMDLVFEEISDKLAAAKRPKSV